MTEKINGNGKLTGMLWAINLLMLTLIVGMLGWYINREADRDAEQDGKITEQQIISYNLAKTIEQIQKNQDACDSRYQQKFDKYDEQFMEVWKQVRRTGSNPDMSQYLQK